MGAHQSLRVVAILKANNTKTGPESTRRLGMEDAS